MNASSPDRQCAHVLRGLAIDAIQKANSGHPGMPLGMADAAVVLWTRFLRYDPSCPTWADRDRFVLSAGHGSSLLYSLLLVSGVDFTMDDLRRFRQLHARTAGHPEHGEAPMIETTTGPLGQGFANAVGMAMAERALRERFGAELCDHHTWVIAGDGCLMEGVCAEAASLAGHLRLGRLNVLWDDNGITIDGSAKLAFTEDVAARFAAYGWHVQKVDGHDPEAVAAALASAREDARPSLVCCRTTIGFGSPNKAGKNSAHGSPLGEAEVRLTRQALGLDPDRSFHLPDEVVAWFRSRDGERRTAREAWEARLAASPRAGEWEQVCNRDLSDVIDRISWPSWPAGSEVSTRKAGGRVIAAVAEKLPTLLGGSADLAGSNVTYVANGGDVTADDFTRRNLHFGIREHAMGAICAGLALHGFVPYCATFLVFHDYMRPAVRLAAMMKQRVIYVYTHDSIFVGEDGPTHQPIEQLMALRGIPNLVTLRPADANEVSVAWRVALSRKDGPTALLLTRQDLPVMDRTVLGAAEGVSRGGYVLREARAPLAVVIIATGSEVAVALQAADRLEAEGVGARVVNLASWELFDAEPTAYRRSVLPAGVPRVTVEAGRTLGWERYAGLDGAMVGIDRFGVSAPGEQVAEYLGITVDGVVRAARSVLGASGA